MWKKFSGIASSGRLAVYLIAALLVLSTAASLIPQTPGSFTPAGHAAGPPPIIIKTIALLKLNRVFTSPAFFVVLGALFINVTFCMSRRVRLLFEDSEAAGRMFSLQGLPMLGSLLFHLSFLVIISGAVYDKATRMKGAMFIAEGQEVVEKHDSYVNVVEAPFFLENHTFAKVLLKDFDIKFVKGRFVEMDADIVISDAAGNVEEHVVRINEPALHDGLMFVMQKYGFAPRVTITGADGKNMIDTYFSLAPTGTGAVADTYDMPGTDLSVMLKLYPDAEIKDGKIRSRTEELRAPVFRLQVDRKLKGGRLKQRLYRGYMKPGETVSFDGYRFTVGDEIRYWLQFDVEREPGKKIVYAGYWLGLAGITLRLILTFMKPLGGGAEEKKAG